MDVTRNIRCLKEIKLKIIEIIDHKSFPCSQGDCDCEHSVFAKQIRSYHPREKEHCKYYKALTSLDLFLASITVFNFFKPNSRSLP